MKYTEREIKMEQVKLFINQDSVTIGKNIIPKKVYEENKELFDKIIESGDEAWKHTLQKHELTEFITNYCYTKP